MSFPRFVSALIGRVSAVSHKKLTCTAYLSAISHRPNVRTMSTSADLLSGLDQTQIDLLKEECILVNEADQKVGSASKKNCHLLENINKGMLHRAFSVFLFDSQGRLLLQQRSSAKITYPDHFTNTCCSHPLNFQAELEEGEALGVRRAAQRKLLQELGIRAAQVPVDDFHYLTRIHYQADNVPADGVFGEHEIDYILFIQADVDLNVNDNEVQSVRYLSKDELRMFLEEADANNHLITPWFKLIVDKFLYKWWDKLDDLSSQRDRHTIHRM